MKGWGITLLIAGALLAVVSYFLPVSVESYSSSAMADRIINLGKLQTQSLVFQSGAVLFLAGSVFTAIGALGERLVKLDVQQAAPPASPVITPAIDEDNPAPLSRVAKSDDSTGTARIEGGPDPKLEDSNLVLYASLGLAALLVLGILVAAALGA